VEAAKQKLVKHFLSGNSHVIKKRSASALPTEEEASEASKMAEKEEEVGTTKVLKKTQDFSLVVKLPFFISVLNNIIKSAESHI